MRKTNDGLQVLTALEKAEQRLSEAIENAQKYNLENQKAKLAKKTEDPITELKESEKSDIKKKKTSGAKTLYGYAPEFSRSSELETDIKNISDEEKKLLNSILSNEKETVKDISISGKNVVKDKDRNEEFHSGYDAIQEIATLNEALSDRKHKSLSESLIGESQDYEMQSFNEVNVFDDSVEEDEYSAPSNFELHSFDDEDEEEIKPYDINQALILGDVIPPDTLPEDLETISVEGKKTAENGEDLQALAAELLENAGEEADKIVEQSQIEAQNIIEEAEEKAQRIIEEKVQIALDQATKQGYAEGFESGQKAGFTAAADAVNVGMKEEAASFRDELQESLELFEKKKEEILEESINDLTDLAINVAEKVINISLKSSKDVVSKMIVAAAENCRNKEWAKVYISHEDKAIAMNLEKELMDALNQISQNVRVIIMEDEPSGTCIIESPDQIVDAGVNTQMDNIRQLVKDSKM